MTHSYFRTKLNIFYHCTNTTWLKLKP